ncbi:hypothetical protein F6V30_09300 [Oryzomonas sagensis]|uniref:Uncharacterized protein n=1 Tax=Oryzomonas sagensis TaxID=2603857 RepID=A0ABQ6TP52_9BACT|nr:hypothetical protein [Oryzomonas sagensis]KAB0670338.1 hypothetical protein F6V30_09300 [Oryzomonas sagensis]
MRILGEWKSLLTLIATVVGVAVPIWLWQADSVSKSLSVKLITRAPLQAKEQDSVPGMEISVDGTRLEKPRLVIFEIRNDGRKPVLATDFESPLEIRLDSKTSFVKTGVTSKSPKDIEASIISEQKRISLKPILLNPKDSIQITALTSGEDPVFNTKARIVGISEISLTDISKEKIDNITIILLLLNSLLGFIALSIMIDVLVDPIRTLRKRAVIIVMIAAIISSMITYKIFMEKVEFESIWQFIVPIIVLMALGGVIAATLNKNESVIEAQQQQ